MTNILLISNSTMHGSGYLDHCEPQIRESLEGKKEVLFIPYARPGGISMWEYTDMARERFSKMEIELKSIREFPTPQGAVKNAEAIFVGGGNTFLLLKELYAKSVMGELARKVIVDGAHYIGASAGSNVAGKTIMTTNDMPIVYPQSFNALELVPFNINPHYLDPDPNSTHKGETRETRIKEYHVFNDSVVVGLREGAMLHVIDDKVTLKGSSGARVFKAGESPIEYKPGDSLDFLLR